MIALLAPGQGSQSPGMLSPWLELDGAAERIAGWSDAVGIDLQRLGTTADAEEIKDTAITQPLVVALTLLVHGELTNWVRLPADAPVAGHSIGEVAAASIAGVLEADDAVRFASVRGAEMAKACAAEPTGMSAVLGGDPEEVLAALQRLGLEPANRNGAGQIVAAGPLDALSALTESPPQRARISPLKVAGAFHTRYMAPAEDGLGRYAAELRPADPTRPLLSNTDGEVVTGSEQLLRRLVAQVTKPVRWDSCMATLAAMGVDAVLEFPPAGTLTGLVRRELKGTTTLALRTPDDLNKAAELVAEHAGGAA